MKRRTAWILAALCGALLTLALWASSASALAQALQLVQHGLALTHGGHSPLTVEHAEGSLLQGGRITRLRWQRNGLDIDIDHLQWQWPRSTWLHILAGQDVQTDVLQMRALRVTNQPPPSTDPLTPPTDLALPWLRSLQIPLQVQTLAWHQDGMALQLGPVHARYQYHTVPAGASFAPGSPLHTLNIEQLHWAQGKYQAQLDLQAVGPMTLDARLQGQAPTQVPGGSSWTLGVLGKVSGSLATPEARLHTVFTVHGHSTTHQSSQSPPQLQLNATLMPWASLPLHSGALELHDIDLAALWPQAPVTRLGGRWEVTSTSEKASEAGASMKAGGPPRPWNLQGQLHNSAPGPWDQNRLPLQTLQADLQLQDQLWQLNALQASLGGGQLQASGSVRVRPTEGPGSWLQRLGHWQGQAKVSGLQPQRLFSTWRMAALDLQAQAANNLDSAQEDTAFNLQVTPRAGAAVPEGATAAPHLHVRGVWNTQQLRLQQARLAHGDAALQGQGVIDLASQGFDGQFTLRLPGATGHFQGIWSAHATTSRHSQAGLEVQQAGALQNWLLSVWTLAKPVLPATLASSVPDWLQSHRLQGQASLRADWHGPAPTWPATARSTAAAWHAEVGTPSLALIGPRADGTTGTVAHWQQGKVSLNGQGPLLTAQHSGTLQIQQWSVQIDAQASARPAKNAPGSTVFSFDSIALQARHRQRPGSLQLRTLQAPELHWHGPHDMTLQPGQLEARFEGGNASGPMPVSAQPLMLAWDTTRWRQGSLSSRGQVRSLALSWLNAWLAREDAPHGPLPQAGLQGDLLFDGQWDITLPLRPAPGAPVPRATVQLTHTHGDMGWLNGEGPRGERFAAGVQHASAQVNLQGSALSGELRWVSQQAGQVDAQWRTTLTPPHAAQPHWTWAPTAPLQGRLQAQLPQIGLWSRLAPPGWRMRGSLQADATLSGTRQQPSWQGSLRANDLALRSVLDGLEFSQGELRASLAGDTLRIDSLRLRGAGGETGGWLQGTGSATWAVPSNAPPGSPRQPLIDFSLTAQQLRLLARADRRLTLSGQLQTQLRGEHLDIRGRLQADQALLMLPDASTPTLGSDVVVRGQTSAVSVTGHRGTPVRMQLNIALGLGENFQVRGRGIDTHLAGRLQLQQTATQATPQLTGQVRTVHGSYRAYGQTLTIETGTLRFNGPYDNPTLDILALRPHPTQKAGVQVSGTAQAPQVRLYAEPDLPDSEKLAWLVLGRPASGTGAEAAILQQAAIALLSGQGGSDDRSLSSALGLDDISYQSETHNSDGSTTAGSWTLGKRLSQQLYVSYTRSLVGAMGTIAVLYDVSRYLTLRAQAGDDNALDVVFTHKFD